MIEGEQAMFKTETVKAIAMVLLVAVTFSYTGITEAAVSQTAALPQQSAPWVPLTDTEMSEVEGGWIGQLALIVIGGLIVCAVCAAVKYAFTPDEEPTEDIKNSADVYAPNGEVIVDYTVNGCKEGTLQSVSVGQEGEININIQGCPWANIDVTVNIVQDPN
jgi:hypothetical protein